MFFAPRQRREDQHRHSAQDETVWLRSACRPHIRRFFTSHQRDVARSESQRQDNLQLVTPAIKTSNHFKAIVPVPVVDTSSCHVALYFPVHLNPQAPGRTPAKRNYKTELCKHWNARKANPQAGPFRCPYGDKCNFAHGPNDLAWCANAEEMHANGMIENPDTYLCLPCFNFVATGSCPMGSRCNSLHDPRVYGSSPLWLELFTKPKTTSLCAIPDGLHYHRDISRFQTNPIIDYHAWKLFGNADKFHASYNLVCNLDIPIFDKRFVLPKHSLKLDEVHRLCIVRAMQKKDSSNYDFTYSNKCFLNGQACMLLQTCYFRLLSLKPNGATIKAEDIISEVSKEEYDCNRHAVIRADEIVFESKGRHNCNRSIWFDANIQNSNGPKNTKRQDHSDLWHVDCKALFCVPKNLKFEMSLPAITPHVLMQSKDDCKEGYELIDAILEHRIGNLLNSQGYQQYWINNIAALEADFSRLFKITEKWAWPTLTKEQVGIIFQKTREEHTNNKYTPLAMSNKEATLPAIWSSFMSSLGNNTPRQKKRLDVFVAVTSTDAKEKEQLPHITNSSTKFISCHSEDTWKELLLGKKGAWMRAKLESDAKRAKVDFDACSQIKGHITPW